MLIAIEYGLLAIYLIYELLKSELVDREMLRKIERWYYMTTQYFKRKKVQDGL